MNPAKLLTALFITMLAALPASGTYKLNSYGFGGGGTADSTSTNYAINGIAGDGSNGSPSSTSYGIVTGDNGQKQANVPIVTLSNPASYYNKLLLLLDPQNNPSDALFAVAISSDGFTTTQYIKSDLTVGSSLTLGDYQTYSAWGSGSGVFIRGLTRSTVYSVKAKAIRGKFTESPYGPVSSSATTDDPQISFDIDVASTDVSTSPPYLVNFGNLSVGSVVDAPVKVWISLDTNAESGGNVYVSGLNTGLKSLAGNYTIGSSSANLSALTEGYGAQGSSATQSSGGPLTLASPYNGAGQNIGVIDGLIRQIFTASTPVTGGRGSFLLKAKIKALTPSSGDYTDTLTAIAAASF